MAFFSARCPVDDEKRRWIDSSFARLSGTFGAEILADGPLVVPTAEFFPNPYDGSFEAVADLVARVCAFMRVETSDLVLRLAGAEELQSGARGTFTDEDGKLTIALDGSQLGDALSVVAMASHEVGHVRLVGKGHRSGHEQDHLPLIDLTTVFFGFGIFTANAAVRSAQWGDGRMPGGLSEQEFGYALALYAWFLRERKPAWSEFLAVSVREHCRDALRYLGKHPPEFLAPLER